MELLVKKKKQREKKDAFKTIKRESFVLCSMVFLKVILLFNLVLPQAQGYSRGECNPRRHLGGPAPPFGELPGPSAAGPTCHLLAEGGEVARHRRSCRLAAPTHGGEFTPRVLSLGATLRAAGSMGKRLVKRLCGIRVQEIALQKSGHSRGRSGVYPAQGLEAGLLQ